ncbi:MAG: type II toxin-antitoxin system RelE/ParE family toxin [Staphylococcus sp.]|nr:type II toxin-antitoxin system RelE/ParE family toxin [Staphylococcus sp.]
MDKQIFRLIMLPEAIEFLDSLPDNVREKIFYNIRKVRGGVKDIRLFKKLGDTSIWEFRTEWMGIAYRLLAFWDKDGETLVVATHGFKKKQQKTPQNEIEHAKAIMKEYFTEKIN